MFAGSGFHGAGMDAAMHAASVYMADLASGDEV